MIYNSKNNKYEEAFVAHCLNKLNSYDITVEERTDPNLLSNSLCPSVLQTMLDDISRILPDNNTCILNLLEYAHDLLNYGKESHIYNISPGCNPEYYALSSPHFQNLHRIDAILAIWLLKYLRYMKEPFKSIEAYSKRIANLQWCLLRMFFMYSCELRPDHVSKSIEKSQWDKFGKAWYDVRNFQIERVQVFLDILHAYSFEYYPPYCEGEIGQRGEIAGKKTGAILR